jgi:hypothetical protein
MTSLNARLVLSAVSAALLGGTASAKELPCYELSGFPMSPHQTSILGTTRNLQEEAPSPSLTMDGMPASPNQLLVLTPHRRPAR